MAARDALDLHKVAGAEILDRAAYKGTMAGPNVAGLF